MVDEIDKAQVRQGYATKRPAAGAVSGPIGRGTIITNVNRKPVRGVQDFRRLMNAAQGKSVLLTVTKGEQSAFVVVHWDK